jgi:hypothetical protein
MCRRRDDLDFGDVDAHEYLFSLYFTDLSDGQRSLVRMESSRVTDVGLRCEEYTGRNGIC